MLDIDIGMAICTDVCPTFSPRLTCFKSLMAVMHFYRIIKKNTREIIKWSNLNKQSQMSHSINIKNLRLWSLASHFVVKWPCSQSCTMAAWLRLWRGQRRAQVRAAMGVAGLQQPAYLMREWRISGNVRRNKVVVVVGQIVLTPITATARSSSYLGRRSHSLIFRTYGSAFCIIVY